VILDILAAIVVGGVVLRWLERYDVKPVAKLTDEQKLEQRRRDERRARDRVNAAYELDDQKIWWI
jgi:hypothetical protein